MSRSDLSISKQRGFSLIEVLVSSIVFVIGVFGITMMNNVGMKATASNQVRAQAIKASSAASEPLLYNTRPDCLSSMISTVYPKTVTADDGKDSYVVKFVRAVDGKGSVVASANANGSANITVASTSWSSPVTITLATPYQSMNGEIIGYSSYTVILQSYTLGCDQ